MGSTVRFVRPRPLVRLPQKSPIESSEAQRSLFILIGSFFVAAIVMCGVVVAMVSRSWMDVVWMSAFVFVFAVVKIGLADALIYVMVRHDREMEKEIRTVTPQWRLPPRPPTPARRLPSRKTTALHLASGRPHPEAPAG